MKDNELALRATWDKHEVETQFNQQARSAKPDKAGHEGYLLFIPPTDTPQAAITIYPESAHVRVQVQNGDFHIRNATPPTLTASGMHLESADGTTQLLVTRAGAVALQIFPVSSEPLESPTGIPNTTDAQIVVSEGNAVPSASSDEIRPSREVSATASPAEGRERQQRKKWTGYISADPAFSTGTDGVPRANFVVSEKIEIDGEEKTIYHRVYTTKQDAAGEPIGLPIVQTIGYLPPDRLTNHRLATA